MRDLHDIYLDILYQGLLNARTAGYLGDAAQAATEADHLHNLPELLRRPDDASKHLFYWECMRTSYLGDSKPEYTSGFCALWHELSVHYRDPSDFRGC